MRVSFWGSFLDNFPEPRDPRDSLILQDAGGCTAKPVDDEAVTWTGRIGTLPKWTMGNHPLAGHPPLLVEVSCPGCLR